jgi:hypothetical protein
MNVADLRASCSKLLSRRAVIALHQPRVGKKILNPIEAADVVNLVEDRQRQDFADPWDGAQSVIGLGIVLLGSAFEVAFEVSDDFACSGGGGSGRPYRECRGTWFWRADRFRSSGCASWCRIAWLSP